MTLWIIWLSKSVWVPNPFRLTDEIDNNISTLGQLRRFDWSYPRHRISSYQPRNNRSLDQHHLLYRCSLLGVFCGAFVGDTVTLDILRGTFTDDSPTLFFHDAFAGEAAPPDHWPSHSPNRCAACWYIDLFDESDSVLSWSEANNFCNASLP